MLALLLYQARISIRNGPLHSHEQRYKEHNVKEYHRASNLGIRNFFCGFICAQAESKSIATIPLLLLMMTEFQTLPPLLLLVTKLAVLLLMLLLMLSLMLLLLLSLLLLVTKLAALLLLLLCFCCFCDDSFKNKKIRFLSKKEVDLKRKK